MEACKHTVGGQLLLAGASTQTLQGQASKPRPMHTHDAGRRCALHVPAAMPRIALREGAGAPAGSAVSAGHVLWQGLAVAYEQSCINREAIQAIAACQLLVPAGLLL
eukprot:GHRQ01033351.1.p1 GENE.GHRQ01033351.1~~GHRQ01033351.1.p1  ORF type:complete len:107 (+),score=18.24 GHRQ01033351.1:865-1185(+)